MLCGGGGGGRTWKKGSEGDGVKSVCGKTMLYKGIDIGVCLCKYYVRVWVP